MRQIHPNHTPNRAPDHASVHAPDHVLEQYITAEDFLQYQELGYLVKDILTKDEIRHYKQAIYAALDHWQMKTSSMTNIQFLQPKSLITAIQDVVVNKQIKQVGNALLGQGQLVIDNAVLFYAGKDNIYQQGWHRDVMQVPDDEIDEQWFSNDYFHNNIQINVPLNNDNCLWVVPGSHRRSFTDEEKVLFAGSKKMAPAKLTKPLPNGESVLVKAGQAVFYNNNLIHRGFSTAPLTEDRMTLQLGYHSTSHYPTYHFAVLNEAEYSDDYLATLNHETQIALQLHKKAKQEYPELAKYHNYHQTFIKSTFNVEVSPKHR